MTCDDDKNQPNQIKPISFHSNPTQHKDEIYAKQSEY